jgi:hypothetical protein
MARGWESKSVEQQQEEVTSEAAQKRAPLTSEQIAAEHRRRGLELSRRRVLQQLELATNPRHRELLEKTLADLDRQILGLRGAA